MVLRTTTFFRAGLRLLPIFSRAFHFAFRFVLSPFSMIRISEFTSQAAASESLHRTRNYDIRMRMGLSDESIARLFSALFLCVSLLVAFLTKSTYDNGDSILHFLYSEYVPQHPENLLDAWAKPVFTLLSALPSQAGFMGMKFYQCVVAAVSARLAYVVARQLRLPWPALAILFCYAAPDYFRIQFSGLTEPTFGLVLVAGVALAVTGRPGWSAVVISLLPFVRSEGSLMLGIWLVYLVWNRSWRALPWLFFGYVTYSLVGGLVLGDFAWIFTHSPYSLHSQYGHGEWGRFAESVPSWLGWPLTMLTVLGGVFVLRRLVIWHQWSLPLFRAELILIFGTIVAFIFMQSAFWALGLFGSFGMTRVLTVLTPLCAVASLSGLAWLSQTGRSPATRRLILAAGMVVVAGMVFSNDHVILTKSGAAVGTRGNLHWRRDFQKCTDLILADRGAAWLKRYDPGYGWHPITCSQFYYAIPLKLDIFDPVARPWLTKDWVLYLDGIPLHTYLIWDSWFSVTEAKLTFDMLQKDQRFRQLWKGNIPQDLANPAGSQFEAAIFERVR